MYILKGAGQDETLRATNAEIAAGLGGGAQTADA